MHPHSTTPLDHDLLEGEQALRRIRSDLEALIPPFRPRILHVPYAVSVLLGAQPTVQQMLPMMASYTPLANVGRIAHLRDYGLAAAFVYHRSLPRDPADPPEYRALIKEAYALRRRLLSSAAHLASLGLLDARRVEEIRAGRGHVGVGDGLLALASLFGDHWLKLKDNTPIERHELHRAVERGSELLGAVTERRGRKQRSNQHDDLPRRALHMMCEVYEEARRVAAYIGWYERGLRPLPSLVRRHSRGRVVAADRARVELPEHFEHEDVREPHLIAAQ